MNSEIAKVAQEESIPTNWQQQQLSEVAEIIMGQSPPSSTYNNEGIGLPFFQGRTEFGSRYPTAVKWCDAPKKISDLGDVLISVRAPVGDVNLAPHKCCIGRGLAAIRAKDNSSSLFIYYLLIYAKERLERKETGATFGNVSKSILENFEIPLPPLPTQRKIAAILSAYDDLIENNNRRIKLLEQAAQDLYREWFVHFRYPGHEAVEMMDSGSDYGMIPRGWGVVKLDDAVELAYGKSLKKSNRISGEYPVYGSAGVIDTHNKFLVKAPGIVVGRKGNVGSVFWADDDFYPIDTVYYVKTEICLYYVYFNLKHQNFINNDAAVPGLSRRQAYLLPFVIPPQSLTKRFEDVVAPIFNQIYGLRRRNTVQMEARDILLPRLVSGELDVSEIEIQGVDL